jgi:tetratricopeptide (TPR) repeat protein
MGLGMLSVRQICGLEINCYRSGHIGFDTTWLSRYGAPALPDQTRSIAGAFIPPGETIRMHDLSSVASEVQRLATALAENPLNAQLYIQRGMASFQLGDIGAAIEDFDRAEHLLPTLTPYLWQRGIAYYYAERFEDGARQFEVDLSVNGHDVEETVWRYLCQAQLHGVNAARSMLLPVRNDSRPVMNRVYDLFAGACSADEMIGQYRTAEQRNRFYSHLYVGLYFEAARYSARARHHIAEAVEMQILEDYMGWVAIVHQRLRGWTPS